MSLFQTLLSRIPQQTVQSIFQLSTVAMNAVRHGDPWWPQQVFIEIQTRCNRACHYCPEKFKRGESLDMSRLTFTTVLNRLSEAGWNGPVAYHIYNEPMKDKRLAEFIWQTRQILPKSYPIVLSNGDYATPDLMADLIIAGLTRCCITRHPPFNANWDRRVNALRDRWPNVIRIHEVTEEYLFNPAGMIEGLEGFTVDKCYSPTGALPIRYNGDVSPCCCDYDRTVVLGNLVTTDLKTIWTSTSDYRKKLRRGERVWEICRKCPRSGMSWSKRHYPL